MSSYKQKRGLTSTAPVSVLSLGRADVAWVPQGGESSSGGAGHVRTATVQDLGSNRGGFTRV